mmetsp:Transcript_35979/g.83871  ORF Transcript_35979/g.83871 Transcript_35979/m.83871 type:complete len:436 (+) Transcript_35979:3986-5293(+)
MRATSPARATLCRAPGPAACRATPPRPAPVHPPTSATFGSGGRWGRRWGSPAPGPPRPTASRRVLQAPSTPPRRAAPAHSTPPAMCCQTFSSPSRAGARCSHSARSSAARARTIHRARRTQRQAAASTASAATSATLRLQGSAPSASQALLRLLKTLETPLARRARWASSLRSTGARAARRATLGRSIPSRARAPACPACQARFLATAATSSPTTCRTSSIQSCIQTPVPSVRRARTAGRVQPGAQSACQDSMPTPPASLSAPRASPAASARPTARFDAPRAPPASAVNSQAGPSLASHAFRVPFRGGVSRSAASAALGPFRSTQPRSVCPAATEHFRRPPGPAIARGAIPARFRQARSLCAPIAQPAGSSGQTAARFASTVPPAQTRPRGPWFAAFAHTGRTADTGTRSARRVLSTKTPLASARPTSATASPTA